MLTLHVQTSPERRRVTLSQREFERLLSICRSLEPIEIFEEDDPDELTPEERGRLRVAEQELQYGATVSLDEFIRKEGIDVSR